MLEREVRQHHVVRVVRDGSTRAAQVDRNELVEVGERRVRGVQVDTDESIDALAEADERRFPPAAGVEDGDGPG